jgi:hypothetical protein
MCVNINYGIVGSGVQEVCPFLYNKCCIFYNKMYFIIIIWRRVKRF